MKIELFKKLGVDIHELFKQQPPDLEKGLRLIVETDPNKPFDYQTAIELGPDEVAYTNDGVNWFEKSGWPYLNTQNTYRFAYLIPPETVREWWEDRPRISLLH